MTICFQLGILIQRIHRKIFRLLLKPFLSPLFYYLPVNEKRVCLVNFAGKGYGDNPKFIAEELYFRNSSYQLFWLVDNMSKFDFPTYIRTVNINSVKALYIRATSKIWINNIRNDHPIRKKKNQLYLQTWHGPCTFKCIEAYAENKLNKDYIKAAKYDGLITDGILADSQLQEEQFRGAFWLNEKAEILVFGLPRNDYLIRQKNNINEYKNVREKIGFDLQSFYVLYAPTFRDDYSVEGYKLDFLGIKNALQNKLSRNVIIVVRLHPNVRNQSSFIKYDKAVINGNEVQDVQELALACDCIISDYSSIIIDFVLLEKPVLLCLLDFNDYIEKRGLLSEFYNLPFPVAKTNDELISIIKDFNIKLYVEKVKKYYDVNQLFDDGYAAQRTVDWILNRLKTS